MYSALGILQMQLIHVQYMCTTPVIHMQISRYLLKNSYSISSQVGIFNILYNK